MPRKLATAEDLFRAVEPDRLKLTQDTELSLRFGTREIGELSVVGRCPLDRIHRISETAMFFCEGVRNQAIARVLTEIQRKKLPEVEKKGYRTGSIQLYEGDLDENGGYYAMIATKLRLEREKTRMEILKECVQRVFLRKPDVEHLRDSVASYIHSLLLIDGLCCNREDCIDWMNELKGWSEKA